MYILNVRMTGPVLEGTASAMTDVMLVSAVAEVADYAKFEVLMTLDQALQNPTGYYESQITDQTLSPLLHRIHDNGVVYGPWLEGVGSRNYPVTRFRGYHSFRVARNRMATKTRAIIAAHVERLTRVL